MKTILVVFGTRPEAIKLAPLIKELKRREGIRALVAVSGQHREMLYPVLAAFGIEPDFDLSLFREGQGLSDLTAGVLLGIPEVFQACMPDLVLVQGDTVTAFAGALAAFYHRIPVGHIEAGLRSGSLSSPFPEEFNRRAISLLSRYHFAPTEDARGQLLAEGIDAGSVFVTGNTAIDALGLTVCDSFSHPILDWVGGRRLVILTSHRRENLGEPMRHLFEQIRAVLSRYSDACAIFPLHKNPEVRRVAHEVFDGCDWIRLIEPLDVFTFHNLLARCYLVLSDSGGIQEEATALGKPLLVLRDTTERPEGIASGVLRLVGTDGVLLGSLLSSLLSDRELYASMAKPSDRYGDGRASARIADILMN